MVRFQDIFANFLFLGLFVLAGLSFIIITQTNNESSQRLGQNSLFNESFNSLETTLSELESTSNTQYNQSISEIPKPGFGSIVLFGIVSAGKTFSNVVMTGFGLIINVPLIILGIPQSIVSVIFTWLVILLIVTAWILYKLGG